jgi:hypothetical protein
MIIACVLLFCLPAAEVVNAQSDASHPNGRRPRRHDITVHYRRQFWWQLSISWIVVAGQEDCSEQNESFLHLVN